VSKNGLGRFNNHFDFVKFSLHLMRRETGNFGVVLDLRQSKTNESTQNNLNWPAFRPLRFRGIHLLEFATID